MKEAQVKLTEKNLSEKFIRYITAGDFGGSKSRLALCGENEKGSQKLILKASWLSTDISDIKQLFDEYHSILIKNKFKPARNVVLACAGIISKNGKYCKLTNNDLEIKAEDFPEMNVKIINDFYANAVQVPYLNEEQIIKIPHIKNTELKNDLKTLVVLGPGSGLGVAPIYFNKNKYYPQASEGGHIAYSPSNEIEKLLYDYLKKNLTNGREPNRESTASGSGIMNIAQFLAYDKLESSDEKVRKLKESRNTEFMQYIKELESIDKKLAGRLIVDQHNAGKMPYLKNVINIFIDSIAATARDMVHCFGAYGGVYICGGNARRLENEFLTERFMQIFDNSYTHTETLRATPVYLIKSKTLGLDGSARVAFLNKG